MLDRLRTALADRDRFLTIASLPAFGVWSIFAPTPSLAELPPFAEVGTYAVFIASGPLLLAGTFAGRLAPFVLGHLLVIVGLLSVAGVVLTTSESPISVLIFGYATALSYSLQRALRERKVVREIVSDTGPLPTVERGA